MSARTGRWSSRILAAAGPLITAIYARKSTEQVGVTDEQRSVTRQIEHARAYALARGSGSAGTRGVADAAGGSLRLHPCARRRYPRLRAHRRRHVRRAASGQHLAHYLWWPQRESNPCFSHDHVLPYLSTASTLPLPETCDATWHSPAALPSAARPAPRRLPLKFPMRPRRGEGRARGAESSQRTSRLLDTGARRV